MCDLSSVLPLIRVLTAHTLNREHIVPDQKLDDHPFDFIKHVCLPFWREPSPVRQAYSIIFHPPIQGKTDESYTARIQMSGLRLLLHLIDELQQRARQQRLRICIQAAPEQALALRHRGKFLIHLGKQRVLLRFRILRTDQ